jgi:hypothetical protein
MEDRIDSNSLSSDGEEDLISDKTSSIRSKDEELKSMISGKSNIKSAALTEAAHNMSKASESVFSAEP